LEFRVLPEAMAELFEEQERIMEINRIGIKPIGNVRSGQLVQVWKRKGWNITTKEEEGNKLISNRLMKGVC
jgi:hypothetical protein